MAITSKEVIREEVADKVAVGDVEEGDVVVAEMWLESPKSTILILLLQIDTTNRKNGVL
jgi:hypothetical protein